MNLDPKHCYPRNPFSCTTIIGIIMTLCTVLSLFISYQYSGYNTLGYSTTLIVRMFSAYTLSKVCVGFIWVAYLKGTSLLVLTLPLLLLTLFLGLELLII
jgi:hypothetical protein